MVTYYMRTSADANSTDAYLPKTTEEKAGCVSADNTAVPNDPEFVFASTIKLQAWQPYPTGGGGAAAIDTVLPLYDTEATLEVPNLGAPIEDTIPPLLSGASATPINSFTATATVTTNEAGLISLVTTTSATPPTGAQIKAGQDHTGALAIYATSLSVGIGTHSFSIINLIASTSYWAYFVEDDAAANQSNIASAGFATAGDAVAPILIGSSATVTGPTTATVRTTTDENNGTLYVAVSTSATKPTTTQIKAGQNHTGATVPSGTRVILSVGLKSIDITGLTAATVYYAHFMHEDVATNRSNIPDATSFTTNAASGTAPAVAAQSLGFGALTKAGHMSVQRLVNTGGAITSATINSGNASGHFQISSTGIITPATAGDTANLNAGPYTLNCTFTNAAGSSPAVNITVNITANQAWVSTTAEMTALTWTDASPTARVVKLLGPAAGAAPYAYCDPGNTDDTQTWWRNRSYTSLMTIGAISNTDLPVIQVATTELGVGYNSMLRLPNFMRFEYLDFYAPYTPGQHTNVSEAACSIPGINLGGTTFSHCKLRGNNTALGYIVNPGSNFVAGNTITIGLNGQTHVVPFHTDNATTFADLAAAIATNAGVASAVVITRTGQTGTGNLCSLQVYVVGSLGQPWQFTTTGMTVSGTYNGLRTINRVAPWRAIMAMNGNITDCDFTFEYCELSEAQRLNNSSGGVTNGTGRIVYKNNICHDFNVDCFVTGNNSRVVICYNYMHSPFAEPSSTGHGDFIQWSSPSTAGSISNIHIFGNVSSGYREDGTGTKHQFQGGAHAFMDDLSGAGKWFESVHAHHNITLTEASLAGWFRAGKNCFAWRNTAARDPAALDEGAPVSNSSPKIGEDTAANLEDPVNNNYTDNICASISTTSGSGAVKSGNIETSNVWSTYLTGPIGATYSSKADIIAKCTPKAGYTTKGAVGAWTDFATFSNITGAPWNPVATLSSNTYTTTNTQGTDIGTITKGFDPFGNAVISLTDTAGNKVQLNADGITLEVGSVASTAGTTNCTIRVTDEFGRYYDTVLALTVSTGSGDVTAPVLSTPVGTKTGSTTATLSVSTNEGNGTLYVVCTLSATPPSKVQIKLGQDHTGANAPYRPAGQTISTTGSKSFSATGLAGSTVYYTYFMHEDAAANQSNVAAAASFTTDAGAAVATLVNAGYSVVETNTTLAVVMPVSIVAGNKLILMYGCGLTGAVPDLTAQGFTLLHNASDANRAAAIYWKSASGSETGFNIVLGSAVHQFATILQFSGGTNVAGAAYANSGTMNPDPPALTPAWGSAQNLWGVLYHELRATTLRTINTIPAGYTTIVPATIPSTPFAILETTLDFGVAYATKVATAASDNPAAYALSGTTSNYGNFTFAITPG